MDCPHCHGEIALSREHWGRNWTCPHCRRPFHATPPTVAGQTLPPTFTGAAVATNPSTVTAGGTRQTVALCRGCGQKYFRVSDPQADRCPACGLPPERPAAYGMIATGAPARTSPAGATTAYASTLPGVYAGRYPAHPTPGTAAFEIAAIHSRTSTIQGCVLASAIANVVLGCLFTLTCYGSVIGIPMIVLSVFEFVHYGKRQTTPAYWYASQSVTLGIFEIVVGLFNVISLIMGILVLAHGASTKTACERYGIYS